MVLPGGMTGPEFAEEATKNNPTVVLVDIVMPETNGTELVLWWAAFRARRLDQ